MCWPSPVTSRWCSAARMPTAECSPVITSNREIPDRYGGASGAAGEAHQAGHGLDEEVVAGQRGALAVPKPLIEQ